MARTTTRLGPRRNSAPAWKKITIVLSAPVAMILAIELLHINTWSPFLFIVALIAIVIVVVWGVSKLLGVHLSLGSWD
jgi:hypothetical protein